MQITGLMKSRSGELARGAAHAMTLSLLTVTAIGALSCLAIPLLPSHTQPVGGPH